jgi:hypothetical protein
MNTRLQALQVLKSMVPRREGVWDSVVLVEFGERFLQMENESTKNPDT